MFDLTFEMSIICVSFLILPYSIVLHWTINHSVDRYPIELEWLYFIVGKLRRICVTDPIDIHALYWQILYRLLKSNLQFNLV